MPGQVGLAGLFLPPGTCSTCLSAAPPAASKRRARTAGYRSKLASAASSSVSKAGALVPARRSGQCKARGASAGRDSPPEAEVEAVVDAATPVAIVLTRRHSSSSASLYAWPYG